MLEESFSLSNSDFYENTQNTFHYFWKNEDFTDLTLVTADDVQLKVHKIIMSSGSLFFKHLLSQHTHQHPLVYLKDITHEYLGKIVEFIYLGKCEVENTQLENFLECGKDLRIKGIFDPYFQGTDPMYMPLDEKDFDTIFEKPKDLHKQDKLDKITNSNIVTEQNKTSDENKIENDDEVKKIPSKACNSEPKSVSKYNANKCKLCTLSFKTKKDLKTHMEYHVLQIMTPPVQQSEISNELMEHDIEKPFKKTESESTEYENVSENIQSRTDCEAPKHPIYNLIPEHLKKVYSCLS